MSKINKETQTLKGAWKMKNPKDKKIKTTRPEFRKPYYELSDTLHSFKEASVGDNNLTELLD